MLRLPEPKSKQLQQRRDFSANYSDRIQHVRLVLPQSSVNTIGYQFGFEVGILPEDGGDLIEVCIFQFRSYSAIEFF